MILVSKLSLAVTALIIVTILLVLGIAGYTNIQGSQGEWILYWHLVASAVVLVLFGLLFVRSVRLYRHLDNLIALSQQQGFSPEMSMKKLGKIGEKITLLYFELQSLSEKKSLKIGLQKDLIDFFAGVVKERCAVIDVTGRVLYVTGSFSKDIGGGKAEHIGSRIADLIPGIDVERVVSDLTKQHAHTEHDVDSNKLSFYPVYNRHGDLGYIVVSLEKIQFVSAPTTAGNGKQRRGVMQERLKRIMRRPGR